MVKKLVFTIFVFLGFFATAQIPKDNVTVDVNIFPKETVALSINSEVLLAGELLQYKAYILNTSNRKSLLSKVVYVSLRNQKDSLVFNHKIKVEKGVANGDFFLPSNLQTGVYKLIGYTNFSRNNIQDAFAEKSIYIINTFKKNELVNTTKDTIFIDASTESAVENSGSDGSSEVFETILNKETFGFREKVDLKLKSNSNTVNGNYRLSVRKVNPVEISGEVIKAKTAISSENFYLPELRGELISGVVLSKLGDVPLANREVALTIPGKDFIYKIAKTNSEGRFFFSVAEGYDSEKSIVQLYGDEATRRGFKIVMNEKDFHLSQGEPYFLKLDKQLKDWLEERSIQLQVENAYFDVKKDSILKNKINSIFYDNLGTVFLLDDYTRFPTVRETFIEVITLAAIRGTGDNAKFIVNNEYDPNRIAKFNDIDPLVLVDGIVIQNNEELINYNARDIESIRVVNEPYRCGPKIFSGIIAVETKNGNFVQNLSHDYLNEMELPPLIKQKKYYRPDYSNKEVQARIPDYRIQLFWEPNVQFSGGSYSTTFYTSDVSGTYEISIEGFSEEGKYYLAKSYFQIMDK
ncbi:MAG TPA: hypothetical protein DC015_01170 [Aequorivita sp.]|nr:hypothetical protein [Aequorivita sp.]